MLKKEFYSHFLATLIWLAALAILKAIFTAGAFSTLDQLLSWLVFCLGALLGTFVLDLDHVFYVLLIHPEEETSQKVKHLIKQKEYKEAFLFLVNTHLERTKLSFHNAVFQVFFMVFCFWVLTSTGSWLGKGLVMAMALHLLKDIYHCLLKGKEDFLRRWLFWPLKREVSFSEQKIFVILMLLIFLGLNLLLI